MILGLGAGAVVLGGAAHGAFHRNSLDLRPADHSAAVGVDRAVALTFDDGPNPDATPLDPRRARRRAE